MGSWARVALGLGTLGRHGRPRKLSPILPPRPAALQIPHRIGKQPVNAANRGQHSQVKPLAGALAFGQAVDVSVLRKGPQHDVCAGQGRRDEGHERQHGLGGHAAHKVSRGRVAQEGGDGMAVEDEGEGRGRGM
ncbi:hypothetical protein ACS49_05110 [Bacillus cereus]|nr:hypothetical protein ACS49_05110 [Bacillus cereus]